ncbi:MAG: DUF86 domain-containing protein [Nitrospirota bacterium]
MVVSLKSIRERLEKVESELSLLKEFKELSEEEFLSDVKNVRTAERCFQIAIDCCHDIANHIIAEYNMTRPDRYQSVFEILGKEGVFSEDFTEKLKKMARFRNLLVHLYLKVLPEEVYHNIQNNLLDFETFSKGILKFIEENPLNDS